MTETTIRDQLPASITDRDLEYMDFGTYAAVIEGDYP